MCNEYYCTINYSQVNSNTFFFLLPVATIPNDGNGPILILSAMYILATIPIDSLNRIMHRGGYDMISMGVGLILIVRFISAVATVAMKMHQLVPHAHHRSCNRRH